MLGMGYQITVRTMSTNTSSHNVETPATYLSRLTNLDEVSLLGDTESIVSRSIAKTVQSMTIMNYQESRPLFHTCPREYIQGEERRSSGLLSSSLSRFRTRRRLSRKGESSTKNNRISMLFEKVVAAAAITRKKINAITMTSFLLAPAFLRFCCSLLKVLCGLYLGRPGRGA